ncbi:hypothetical protein D9757_002479 [Collybiopsis confluens]|uniref:Fanconi-associated nuclease n=1 Tax=Collybiopsis confluens TaxID=2823264 RepID=A0A8H5MF28_9AGAR|nr:hypothetical protein D9757_002479 [Collybiopsis confluens]
MNTLTTQLIFGSQRVVETEDELTELLDSDPKQPQTTKHSTLVPRILSRNNTPSPYVSVFEDIINQVWQYEDYLFSKEEQEAISAFGKLSYSTRYILVRLCLRMPGWHTRKSLEKYISEVGIEGIDGALKELCLSVEEISELGPKEDVKQEEVDEVEFIDLTGDSQDEEEHKSDVTVLNPQLPQPQITQGGLSYLCENQTSMSLEDILSRLSVPCLKDIAKSFKPKLKSKSPTKDELIQALKEQSRSQVNILTMMKKQRAPSSSGKADTSITQEGRLKLMSAKKLGPCIKVNPNFHKLIRKVHIIFYRSTSIPKTLFLDSYLTHFNKRKYPPYTFSRSIIWATVEDYELYEEALDLQTVVDTILDDTIVQPKEFTPDKIPGLKTRFLTPVTPLRDDSTRRSIAPPSPSKVVSFKREEGDTRMEETEDAQQEIEYTLVDLSATLGQDFEFDEGNGKRAGSDKLRQSARIVDIYNKTLKAKWDSCMAVARVKREKDRDPFLERFEQGKKNKVAEAYALLHKFGEELKILQALLEQNLWRRAKRGRWYDRRALLKDFHLSKDLRLQAEQNGWSKDHLDRRKKELWEETRQDLYEALEDEDTHRVYHKSLVSRLDKLEKRLGISGEQRHQYNVQLRKAHEFVEFAFRAERSSAKLGEETQNWKYKPKEDIKVFLIRPRMLANTEDEPEDDSADAGLPKFPSHKGKSVWKTIDETDTCNVEQRALQYYASERGGEYQGFHSETCILTTIFALLFWDILFADVPGAFETKFQIAPLDLMEDSFHDTRKDMIKARLEELENGKALEILNRHDTQYRASKTWCVGVNWDVCNKEELAQIVECMDGQTLAVICDLFAHDYAARASGVPDLIVWRHEDLQCKFVEVKGPGDRARDNQTLWFDTLLGAGLEVDLCRVEDDNTKNRNKEKERLDKSRAKAAKERLKQDASATAKKRKPRKKREQVEEPELEDDELNVKMGNDDDDFRGPENSKLDEEDVAPRTIGKRPRSEDEDEDLSRGSDRFVLVDSQDKVISQDDDSWSADSVVTIPHPKKRKMNGDSS